jgi:hypothetical protein
MKGNHTRVMNKRVMFRGSDEDDSVPMVVFHIQSHDGHCRLVERGSEILQRVKNILAAQIGMPQHVDPIGVPQRVTERMRLRVLHGHRTAEHPAGARTHYLGDPVH